MHPLRNVFDSVPFGKNKHGILVATIEDHLHAYRLGIMLNLAARSHLWKTKAIPNHAAKWK
jgi:hypothetical protein